MVDCLRQKGDDVLVFVRVKPRSSRSRVLGEREGRLEISLRAPPVDGAANDELIRFLSKALGVQKRQLVLEQGSTSRHKVVRVSGVTFEMVRQALTVNC